jgi:hypothetical protein
MVDFWARPNEVPILYILCVLLFYILAIRAHDGVYYLFCVAPVDRGITQREREN